ncbi:period circadian protein homolog 1 isoform X1 [Varanus komodoensis]|uniref:period circadian protein homolog 1 isoform X1 n=2 Tax=Varanus komodoensis TaxID=61221 RepID=UPI001CF7E7BE|nr:period circadian protein homolog 1 isoform X1 [Varanus komodoensis]XP_044273219.1 period circadian protein homolog 1 isoform X1 [Varanus komodoensis]XP_044273220.1 period circadian protein homolog 1 isoform X1 [Varanus komodoensis]XP_044273221.1 period circadian protein homolog 1 isoform X1 [Varanus komodoensis]
MLGVVDGSCNSTPLGDNIMGVTQDVLKSDQVISAQFGQNIPRVCSLSFPRSLAPAPAAVEVPTFSLPRLPAPQGGAHVPEPVMSAACEPVQNHFEGAGGVGSGSSGAPRRGRAQRGGDAQGQANDDMDVNSNGSSGNESHGDSHSSSHSSGNGKDSALLETTESNKSSNSQSPSPPSSSIAYSLLSASSEQDNPSTSGCSSEQSARVKTQKELMKALKEMKIRLPSEKRGKGKSGTLATLQYALSCVKQVQASQDYYQQWTIDERQPCNLDMPTCTIEELENITAEYILKNPDTFSVAISFITGKIAYISDQAAFILRCKKEVFKGAKFAEFLAPQDVSIFYGSTAPYHLPSWSACASATAAMDYTQEKSVFCRISGGHESGRELRYYPFRLTPYLAKVRDSGSAEGQPCCLLIAERIHSGYEAPRIPPDKRIFTTRHTPSCLFQDVDERAAPLLGYLPQDLVGMPVLFYLHPEDRPLMLAIHKKILQYAGQPFDHSPIRFCARNGEYVTIDTSWSSFVNPWSRKVSFIMGRHKVRTGPLNEDVFTAPKTPQVKPAELDFQGLSEQIHRLLLQPVHSSGSMGLCSLGSNASHEQFLSVASSSDSNGIPNEEAQAARPMTFQEICKDVHMVKNQGQQVFIESRVRPQPAKHSQPALEAPARGSLQPALTQRELDREPGKAAASEESLRKDPSNYSYQQINCLDGIIRYLESYSIPSRVKRKCGSSSYTTSSNSDDDKQKVGEEVACPSKDALEEMLPTPESQPKRDERGTAAAAVVGGPLTPLALPSKAESVASVTSQCSFSSTIVHVGDKKPPESDIVMMEEAAPSATPPAPPPPSMTPDREQQYRKVGLTKEVLSVHTQQEEQAFLTRFKDLSRLHVFDAPPGRSWQEPPHAGPQAERGHRGPRQGTRGPGCRGRSRKSKAKRIKQQNKLSDSTSSPPHSASPPQLLCAPGSSSWPPSGNSQASLPAMPYPAVMPTYPIPVFPPRSAVPPAAEPAPSTLPAPQFPTPLVAPMVALVLPNYVFPQMNSPLPPSYFPGGPVFPFGPQPGGAPTPGPEAGPQALSRPSTPHSMSQPERAESPLFESRCSSPLQLNLLQMEEMPKPCDRPEGVAGNPAGPAGATPDWAGVSGGPGLAGELGAQEEPCLAEAHGSSNNDALSSSSDLLDLLLQEDSRSGTGSAASGSGSAASGFLGSGSNGDSTSASGTASSKSSNTSKYFGSIDSSENDLRGKKRSEVEDNEHFIKYVLQDPIWLLMANTDDKVMMTYQLPARDTEAVLREDREKLKQMQKRQPRFTDEQKKELAEVHSWVQKGALPKAINITACVDCGSNPTSKVSPLYDVEIQDMDLNGMLEPMEEGGGAQLCLSSLPPEVAMEEEEAGAEPGEPAARAQAAAGVAPAAPRH